MHSFGCQWYLRWLYQPLIHESPNISYHLKCRFDQLQNNDRSSIFLWKFFSRLFASIGVDWIHFNAKRERQICFIHVIHSLSYCFMFRWILSGDVQSLQKANVFNHPSSLLSSHRKTKLWIFGNHRLLEVELHWTYSLLIFNWFILSLLIAMVTITQCF